MLLIQVLLIQVSTIIIFDNLYVQNQSTTTAQALARTKTRMTTWLNSNFRGRWKEVSGPNVTLASNQWMIVMRIGKQGGNYDYHYWYRTNDGPWANKHGQTPSVLLPASDMPTTNSSSGWTLNGKTGFYNSSIVYCQLLSEYVISCACVPLCYEEAARDERADTSKLREQLQLLREKIARREVEKYQSKFTEALAEASARVKDLGVRYQRENAAYKAFHAGMECPACHRSVTEQSLPEVQAALKKVLSELYAAGSEQRAQLIELQEMDKKAADTFAQFKEDDLGKWAAEAAEMEQRCASLAEQASAETERLRAEIQTLTADLEYGNLSQSEYDHLGTCREELRQREAKIAALQTMTAAQLPDFDREIAQANASIAEIKRKMANVIAYISKRAELTFSQLKMNRVEISLYDVVKSTGEVKDTFKFQYGGRRYDRLSLSEKIRAGMEVSELMKRLTGRNYPVFVDNMESVDDLANVRPTGQIIMAKCVSGAALQVKPIRPIAFAEQRAA